ncbi:MAG TPA: hypothetical protein VFS43_12475 [Polyangiaceae bacterium]|nr:hypothetical protein [Polyangiaceae bacterium]
MAQLAAGLRHNVAAMPEANAAAAPEETVTGTFELHVFVAPLDPPDGAVERFGAACRSAPAPMKALLLRLDYVDRGFVGVLQSSRYVTGDVASARAAARADAEALRAAGLEVVREKVEAVAQNPGVPQTGAEGRRSPADRYFEFHLLIDGRRGPLSEGDMRELGRLSAEFSRRLGTPVPLSYNALKPAQRFLNLRARGVGLDEAQRAVAELRAAVEAGAELDVKKVIAEYICFDSNRAVDDGWLEPLP